MYVKNAACRGIHFKETNIELKVLWTSHPQRPCCILMDDATTSWWGEYASSTVKGKPNQTLHCNHGWECCVNPFSGALVSIAICWLLWVVFFSRIGTDEVLGGWFKTPIFIKWKFVYDQGDHSSHYVWLGLHKQFIFTISVMYSGCSIY